MKYAAFLLLISMACIVPVSASSAKGGIPRLIEYSFTVKNATNHLIPKAEFLTYAPAQQTATQKCVNITASQPYEPTEDDGGNKIITFKLKDMPPFSQRVITIKTNLLLSKEPESISVKKKLFKTYLLPAEYIESTDPHITKLAETLKNKKPENTVQNIAKWINDNVKYIGYVRNRHGALYALTNKSGDCTEFADLFTALCRADGIETRRISGYVCKENMILKPFEYHDWAEYYCNGRWHVSDIQSQPGNNYDHIAFHIESGNNKDFDRFKVFPEGIQAEMNK